MVVRIVVGDIRMSRIFMRMIFWAFPFRHEVEYSRENHISWCWIRWEFQEELPPAHTLTQERMTYSLLAHSRCTPYPSPPPPPPPIAKPKHVLESTTGSYCLKIHSIEIAICTSWWVARLVLSSVVLRWKTKQTNLIVVLSQALDMYWLLKLTRQQN